MPLLASISLAQASTRGVPALLDSLSGALLEFVGCTAARIHLLDTDARTVTIRAQCAHREIDWNVPESNMIAMRNLPIHERAMSTGQPLVFTWHHGATQLADLERSVLFAPRFQTVLLVPLLDTHDCLGVAVLGEMREWERSPFSQQKIGLARAFVEIAAHAVHDSRMLATMTRRTDQLRILTENVADGILLLDREGRIRFANAVAEQLLAQPSDHIMGRKLHQLGLLANAKPEVSGSVLPLSDIGGFPWESSRMEFKESIHRADGSEMRVNHRLVPIRGEDGQIDSVVSLIRDISREEQALRLRSESVSMVIHELRAPLANIAVSARLLALPDLDAGQRQKMAETVEQECHHVSGHINEILQASQLEGELEVLFEPIAIHPLIEQTVKAFEAREIPRRFEIAPARLPAVALGDRAWVQIILENLIQNAVNYSDPESTVMISAEERDDRIKISVADEGVGIAPDQLDKVFEKFHRVASKGREVAGLGLGLYISKLLAEALGGSIGVTSEPGRGSIFYFTLKTCIADQDWSES